MASFSLFSFFIMQIFLFTVSSATQHEKHQGAAEAVHFHPREEHEAAEAVHIDEKLYVSQQKFETEAEAIAAIKEKLRLEKKIDLSNFEEKPKSEITESIFGEAKEVLECAQKLEKNPKHAGGHEENLKTKAKKVGELIKHKGAKISEKMDELDNYIVIKAVKIGEKYQLVAHYISYPAGGLFGAIGMLAGAAYGCVLCGVHKMANVCLKREKYHGTFVKYIEYHSAAGAIHGFIGAQVVSENFLTDEHPSERGKKFEKFEQDIIKEAKDIKKYSFGIYKENNVKKTEKGEEKKHKTEKGEAKKHKTEKGEENKHNVVQ